MFCLKWADLLFWTSSAAGASLFWNILDGSPGWGVYKKFRRRRRGGGGGEGVFSFFSFPFLHPHILPPSSRPTPHPPPSCVSAAAPACLHSSQLISVCLIPGGGCKDLLTHKHSVPPPPDSPSCKDDRSDAARNRGGGEQAGGGGGGVINFIDTLLGHELLLKAAGCNDPNRTNTNSRGPI